jgi:lactate dehydrogenase-like 2-hydroxyacid dehydrogenase
MALVRSHVQRRVVVFVGCCEIGAPLQQKLYSGSMATTRSHMQRRVVVIVGRGEIGAALEQKLHNLMPVIAMIHSQMQRSATGSVDRYRISAVLKEKVRNQQSAAGSGPMQRSPATSIGHIGIGAMLK